MDDLLRLLLFEIVAPAPAEIDAADAAYAAFVALGKGSDFSETDIASAAPRI